MELNITFFIQAGIYISILLILNVLYFKPLMTLVKRRESMTLGRRSEADELVKKCEDLRTSYQTKIQTARELLDKDRATIIKSVKTESDQALNSAKERIEKSMREQHEVLERELKNSRAKFSTLTADLKKEIVSAVTTSRVVHL